MSEQAKDKWSRKRQLQEKMAKVRSCKTRAIAVYQSALDWSVEFKSNVDGVDQPGTSRSAEIHQSANTMVTPIPESLLSDDSDDQSEEDLDDSERDVDSECDFSDKDAQEICSLWLLEQSQETTRMVSLVSLGCLKMCNVPSSKAVQATASYLGVGKRSVWCWNSEFHESKGAVPGEIRGSWERASILSDEDMGEHVTEWVRKEVAKPNAHLTTARFTRWANQELLPNQNLPPSYPKTISRMTAWRWLQQLTLC